jgi:hypothetical protein
MEVETLVTKFAFHILLVPLLHTGCRSAVPAEALTVSGITPEVLESYPARRKNIVPRNNPLPDQSTLWLVIRVIYLYALGLQKH